MGKYTVIAEVGARLREILCRGLVPDLIQDDNGVGLCSPAEKGDFVVGIYLYDIRENEDVRMQGMINSGLKEQKYPSMFLSLYYMITAYSPGEMKFKAEQEHRILGRTMQLLADNQVIPAQDVGENMGGMDLQIRLVDMPVEDKMKVWNDGSRPYRTSLFYQVAPVELESLKTRRIQRVTDMDVVFEDDV